MDLVWARDPVEGFVLGRISELLQDGAEVLPVNPKFQRRVCQFDDIYRANELDRTYDDNCNYYAVEGLSASLITLVCFR